MYIEHIHIQCMLHTDNKIFVYEFDVVLITRQQISSVDRDIDETEKKLFVQSRNESHHPDVSVILMYVLTIVPC